MEAEFEQALMSEAEAEAEAVQEGRGDEVLEVERVVVNESSEESEESEEE